jgi:predicted DNA-binding transcriptional regulator AlpA
MPSVRQTPSPAIGMQVEYAYASRNGCITHTVRTWYARDMDAQLGITDVARLLGVSRPRVWQLRKRADFPKPVREGGREFWYESAILRWAGATGRPTPESTPTLYRAVDPRRRPAQYLGTQISEGLLLMSWDTAIGRVCVIYEPSRLPRGVVPSSVERLADRIPGADVLVAVDSFHWNAFGPALTAVDISNSVQHYTPKWSELARLFGAPVPYWPTMLRDPEQMIRWSPTGPPMVISAVSPLDITPLLLLAVDVGEVDSAGRAALRLARIIQDRATREALRDIEMLDEAKDRDSITLAATPRPASRPADDVPEDVRRNGWAKILSSADTLAIQCARISYEWNGGADFPFSAIAEVRAERGSLAEEWASNLVSAPERTAAYAIFGEQEADEVLLTDPTTDLPVIRNGRSTFHAAIPQRLPATAPLSKVVLYDGNVWIRTEDGGLYLAPEQSGRGMSWGYSGGGPYALALLLDKLLDDINAPAPGYSGHEEPPPGLDELTEKAPRDGAIYSRAELLAARQRPPTHQ